MCLVRPEKMFLVSTLPAVFMREKAAGPDAFGILGSFVAASHRTSENHQEVRKAVQIMILQAAACRVAAKCKGGHTASLCRLDACLCILHHGALLRLYSQLFCGNEEDLWVGLGTGDIRAVADRVEKYSQPDALQDRFRVFA
jgi:hypothetical protein